MHCTGKGAYCTRNILWENFWVWCWCICNVMASARKAFSLVLSGLTILSMIQLKKIFFTAWWSFWGAIYLVTQFIKWWNYASVEKYFDVATKDRRVQWSGQSEQTCLISSIQEWDLQKPECWKLAFPSFFGGCVLCISLAPLEVYWIASHS